MKLSFMTCLVGLVLHGANTHSAENRTITDGESIDAEVQALRSEFHELEQRLSGVEQSEAEDKTRLVNSISAIEAQLDGLVEQYAELASETEDRQIELAQEQNRLANELRATIEALKIAVDSIRDDAAQKRSQIEASLESTSSTVEMTRADLTTRVDEQNARTGQLESATDNLQNTVRNQWVALAFLTVVLLIITISMYLKQARFRQEALEKLDGVRGTMKDDYVALDGKLLKLIEARQLTSTAPNQEDHSLALKVADEIVRIRKNISRMDESTKGLKQLAASVARIQDNFAANGYEIVEMLGKPYSEGMKAAANFITDESLDEGQQIITRIIKPQVNYEGVMIQSAQIEVSVRE